MLASLVGFGWTKSWIWMFWWEISREISDEEGFGWTIWQFISNLYGEIINTYGAVTGYEAMKLVGGFIHSYVPPQEWDDDPN